MESVMGIIGNTSLNNSNEKMKGKQKLETSFVKTLNKVSLKEINTDDSIKSNLKYSKKIYPNSSKENEDISAIKDTLKKAGFTEEKLNKINSSDECIELLDSSIGDMSLDNLTLNELLNLLQSLFVSNNFLKENVSLELKNNMENLVDKTLDFIKSNDSSKNIQISNLGKELKNLLKNMLNENSSTIHLEIKNLSDIIDNFVDTAFNKVSTEKESKNNVKKILTEIKASLGNNSKIEDKEIVAKKDNYIALRDALENSKNTVSKNIYKNQQKNSFLKEDFSSEEKFLKNIVVEEKEQKFLKNVNFLSQFNRVDNIENLNVEPQEKLILNKATLGQDIIKTVKYMELNNIKDLTVKINPKELGEVIIKVTMENGALKADISAKNKEAFNLLNANISDITNKLQNTDIKIQNFTLSLYEDTTFYKKDGNENNNESKEKGRNSNQRSIEGIEDINSIENLSEDLSNVNILA
ncbi:flagellar hook-length control protein FliK [Clostridium rectalis]|uniref:flagellar hook-length control protein FliK n=1 Tax=Clostridium rectalis TaxID=2040295 RepID=UPI000F630A5F|nr:flagellar hook-length control protein FliK [Clostridium rectalis]